MPRPSSTHLVLIPSYNTGPRLARTVEEALNVWKPVWVVVDGSTDGSETGLRACSELRVIRLDRNRGKGAAVLEGLRSARAAGFTHALTMDADGQHPAGRIPAFVAASVAHPTAMILGRPVFDAAAPRLRVHGRRLSNWCVRVQTLGAGIDDCLCGFRVYPIEPLLAVMAATGWMRRYDFDAEAVVRLFWSGVEPINLAAPIHYPRPEDGGVSHFRYGRDNVLLTGMHLRLAMGALRRLPMLLKRRQARRAR